MKKDILSRLITDYPNYRLIFIYPHSEHDYTSGGIHSIQVDKYYEDDDRFYLWSDFDDLVEFYEEFTTEEAVRKAEDADWEECIVVYITS
jgi:hypothetical protein